MRARFTIFMPLLLTSLSMAGCKKSDDGPRGGDGGSGNQTTSSDTGDDITAVACEEDSECDDFIFCNGAESCSNGFCRRGAQVACDDGIDCTEDRCVESQENCINELPDGDADGSKDASCTDADGNSGDDCDDDNPDVYPGNVEFCDAENIDEDCDPTTIGFRDSDNDGYLDGQCCNEQKDGKLLCGEDCDDHKSNVNPEATEACDFLDNNCDGDIDEGVTVSMYPDKDHDNHGDDSVDEIESCPGAVGFALVNDDCNDQDPEVFKGQFEICDGKDNNCNGKVDEVKEYAPWYPDDDGDGYGDPESKPVLSCFRVAGRVLSQNDCDDQNKTINPNATELCDGLDNDCNGLADYRLSGVNNFEDDDGDGIPDADCDGGTDCNDTDPRTGDGKEEVCDHVDNDCDGEVDEQTVQNIWYLDEDGDGWGVVIGSALASCEPIPRRASQFGDCDDSSTGNAVHPGAAEACDGVDNDCDGETDEGAAVSCKLPNAITACKFGGCQIFSCVPGFADLDPDVPGCETEVTGGPTDLAQPCEIDSDCSDGNICNGIEVCYQNNCFAGTPINCGGPEVLQGDVTISNGLDIKALKGVEIITGNVSITNTFLSNFIGLESLKTIGGDLVIVGNPSLTKLSGSALSNLEFVGGDIVIQNNKVLTSVNLPSLVTANLIVIEGNGALKVIDGYPSLSVLGEGLAIMSNPVLTSILGFPALQRIGAAAGNCEGRCGLDQRGGLDLMELPALAKVEAFPALATSEGGIYLSNITVTDLRLPELVDAGSGLEYTYGRLKNLALPKLQTTGRLSFNDGYYLDGGQTYEPGALETISAPSLKEVAGEYALSRVSALKSIDFGTAWKAEQVSLFLYDDLQSATSLGIEGLTEVLQLTLYLGQPYYLIPNLALDIEFSSLISADTLSLDVSATGISKIGFPQLQTASTIGGYFYYEAQDLTALDFSSLETVQSVYLSYGEGGPQQLATLDFSSLALVEKDFSIYLSLPSTSGQGLVINPQASLYVSPDVNNPVTHSLCTGYYGQQEVINAACSQAAALQQSNPQATISTCGDCL